MVDRLEIDALLISALYGELTPADEARLTAHLESHPADRTALADLTRARTALRESRILTVQLEPPQSVSALLLQEAARRAPKPVVAKSDEERAGFFERFLRSFAARPMMAAAAMLVVMLGVAGTIKMTGGTDNQYIERADHVVEPTAPPAADEALRWGTGADQGGASADAGAVAAIEKGNGQTFDVTLAEGAKQTELAAVPAAKPKVATVTDGKEQAETTLELKNKPDQNSYIDVRPAAKAPQQPKDLDDEDRAVNVRRQEQQKRDENKPADPVATSEQPSPAPPPPVVGGGGAPGATRGLERDRRAPTGTTTTQGGRVVNAEEEKDKEDLSAARSAHNEVVAAVKGGDCTKAGKLAADLSTRAPGYYNSQVQTDRELKACISHINAAREKELTRVRALQKRSADEPARAKQPAAPTRR
jgi:hypothetical protein